MDGVYSLAHHGNLSREDCSLIYRQISQSDPVAGKEAYSRLTGLDAPLLITSSTEAKTRQF